MTIQWPDEVVNSIARRRSVILIGSGVSANSTSSKGERPPTWGDFLKQAYADLNKRSPHIQSALKQFRYLEACHYLKNEYGSSWADYIRKKFLSPQFKPAEIHKAIFDLDSRIVISMNFDKIYDNYATINSDGTVIIKSYTDSDIRQAVAGPDRYVIKPHGTVDLISKMIFTLEDYAKARVEHAPFYQIMNSLLHTHTFICIGCGLSDPDMQILFEDYRYKYNESPHYMTLPTPVSQAEIDLINSTRGVNIIKYSPRDGHRQLTDSLFALVSKVNATRDDLLGNRNW